MTGITALLLFAAWTLVLMFTYVNYRVMLTLTGKKPANSWTRGVPNDDPPFVVRAQHAHYNCVENLPVFAAIVLAAAVLGKSAVVDAVACAYLGLRIAQSAVHLISTSATMVFIRAVLFTGQVLLSFWMIWGLLH
ncbi:MAG TPA: MAPEG family protein [Nevskiaceae bacterium]|nr:MAPEG family protein [Nevskiaceae bacterium]